MATYTADAGEIAVCGRTLTGTVEDVVTLRGNERKVEVRYWAGSGTDPIYLRVNSGSAAAALPAGDGGSSCFELLPGEALKVDSLGQATQVRLICATAAKYSVCEA